MFGLYNKNMQNRCSIKISGECTGGFEMKMMRNTVKYRSVGRKQNMKHLAGVCAGILLVLCGCLFYNVFFVSAQEKNDNEVLYKYYTSIEIQPGDTLWEIASETMTSEYDSVPEYVEVLKRMNDLSSDQIQAGQNLIIAYNDTEYK